MESLAGQPPVTISLESLAVDVPGRTLLSNVTLKILPGMITVIVGGSGAGKSVLLRILAGLVEPGDPAISLSGRIEIGIPAGDGQPLEPVMAARVGVVFQNFALFDQWSCKENVQLAIDHRSDRGLPPEQSAADWLEELRVPQATAVSVLSGGQKQRLAIARTLAAAPAIVLYDEPTSGLDSASGRQVAELIRRTQQAHRRTSIIVTHDYHTLLPIADDVLLLDSTSQSLTRVPRDRWDEIATQMMPVRQSSSVASQSDAGDPTRGTGNRLSTLTNACFAAIDDRMTATGATMLRLIGHGSAGGPFAVGTSRQANVGLAAIRPWWVTRFFTAYLRLVGGPSAIVYLAIAGMIVGFTATYFTFEFLPYRIYSKPLLVEDLLAAIGFALYRILVPVLATILIAARCGAAVAADVGVKRYGSQIEAMRTLGIRPAIYLMMPILMAFLLATPLLNALAFYVAKVISLVCFNAMHPELGPHFWHQHFHSRLNHPQGDSGWLWVMGKTITCGAGIGLISYYHGSRYQGSASDVSDSITATVLWATLFVLVVHFVVALIEF